MDQTLTKNPRNLRGDAFRTYVRGQAPCPTCGAPEGHFCAAEDGSGRRQANHAARVTAVTGQDLSKVTWRRRRRRPTGAR